MKHLFSLLTLGLLATFPLFAAQRIVPIAGHAPGANSTFWTTDLQISNSSAATQVIHLTFHPSGRDAVVRDVTLGGHESTLIEDAVAPSKFGLADNTTWIGELEIESPDDFSASARTFTHGASGDGTFGSVSDSIDPSLLASHGTVTGIVVDDRFRSNLAFTNASDDSVSLHFDLRRRDGSIAGSDDVTIGAHETIQKPVRRSDDSQLSLQWTSPGRAYVVASVIDNRSGDPSDSRSVAATSTSAFFPLVGKTAGANGTFWTTSVSITSTEDRPGTATIEYQDNSGRHESKDVALQSHGSFHSDDIFDFLGLPNGSGLLSVRSSVEITSSARVFNTREDGGTFGSTMQPQDRVSRSSLVRVKGVRRSDDFRLNVAIADDNADDANGTIRLFDDRHNEVEEQRFHVGAHSAQQFAVAQTRIPVGAGEVEIETEHGVEVTVIASNVDNRSGDTVVSENEQEDERQQELDIRMSAKSAPAGTPIVFTAIAPASATAFAWDFGDGATATGATATHAFASGGEFKIMLTVTLSGGAQLHKAEDVTITGAPAGGASALDFTWSPPSPQPGQAVTFTASLTGNAPAGAVVKWQIEGVKSTGSSATHTFAAAGSYEVEAELEQEGLATLHVTHIVTVGSVAPPPNPGTVSINFSWSPAAPHPGQAVTFTATVTGTPASGSSIKWRMPNGSRPTGATTTFTFAAAGTYSVEVELEQPGKTTIQAQHSLTVN